MPDWFNNISISFSYEPLVFILGSFIAILYSVFIYRTTLPPISRVFKVVLILIRSILLILLVLLLFDPILKITSTKKIEPINLVFFDNSKSISEFSDSNDVDKLSNLYSSFVEETEGQTKYYTFGEKLKEIQRSTILDFSDRSSRFSSVLNKSKENKNISSIVIVSDGINNDGQAYEEEFSSLSSPIYTIGIGDTSSFNDLKVNTIRSNEVIYINKLTEMECIINNENLYSETATVQLFDNDNLIETQNISLANNGINRVRFPYTATEEGEHKITIFVSSGFEEKNKLNNRKSTVINVLATKKKITIIAGSPNPDLSIITNSVIGNEDYDVASIIELSANKYYLQNQNLQVIEEADIVFFIGFPSKNSNHNFLTQVDKILTKNATPIFIQFANSLDIINLEKYFNKLLPFSVSSPQEKYEETQVKSVFTLDGLLGSGNNILASWDNLPPVYINKSTIIPSIPSAVLLKSNSKSEDPVVFTNQRGTRKSIVITASNIWRWKLTAPEKDYNLFDNFISNSIKWLSLNVEKKLFNVKTEKKSYKIGEQIIFSGNLFNELYEPIIDGAINLEVYNSSINEKYTLNNIGNGLYEVEVKLSTPGKYQYRATTNNNSELFRSVAGVLNIEPAEIELIERKMNKKYLKSLATKTGGRYLNIDQATSLVDLINLNYINTIKYKKSDKELRLSSLDIILIIVVLLFSIEWILRKFFRMI